MGASSTDESIVLGVKGRKKGDGTESFIRKKTPTNEKRKNNAKVN